MDLMDRIKKAHLLRAQENFEKNKDDSENFDWVEGVLDDYREAEAGEEISNLAQWCVEKEDYQNAIAIYKAGGNTSGLIDLGEKIFDKVKDIIELKTEEPKAISDDERATEDMLSDAFDAEEKDKEEIDLVVSGELEDFGFVTEDMRHEAEFNQLYLAVDALVAAEVPEVEGTIKEIAEFSLKYNNLDLAVYALERGGQTSRLVELGDRALADGQLDKAAELYEKGEDKTKLTLIGDLFAAKNDYNKTERIYKKVSANEKIESLIGKLLEKQDPSLSDLGLMFRLAKEREIKITEEKAEQFYTMVWDSNDVGSLSLAMDLMTDRGDSEKLIKLGDKCVENNHYNLALDAYERADVIENIVTNSH